MDIEIEALPGLRRIAEAYLARELTGKDAARHAESQYGEIEDGIPDGDRRPAIRLFTRLYWAIRLLDEPEMHRTAEAELEYLGECVSDPARYSEDYANRFYSSPRPRP